MIVNLTLICASPYLGMLGRTHIRPAEHLRSLFQAQHKHLRASVRACVSSSPSSQDPTLIPRLWRDPSASRSSFTKKGGGGCDERAALTEIGDWTSEVCLRACSLEPPKPGLPDVPVPALCCGSRLCFSKEGRSVF